MNPVTFADRLDKKLLKAITLGGVIICFLLSAITLPLQYFEYSIFNLITAVICLISYFAYLKRRYSISMYLFFGGVPVLMVLYIYNFGNIASHLYLIPGAIALTFLTKRKKYWHEFIWVVVTLFFLLSEFILYKQGKFTEFNQLENMLHFTNQFSALFLIYVATYYFRNTHEDYRSHLEQNNAIKEKLISVVSHDLRSPINSIAGIIDLFDQDAITGQEFKTLIKKLSVEVNKTSSMLDNTLLWMKNQLESGQPIIEPINTIVFIESTINLYQTQIEEKSIDVSFTCNIDKSFRLQSDAEILKLIIRNILSNAIKFSPDSNGKIKINCKSTAKGLQLTIADNGRGMSQEQVDALFNLNKQISSGTRGEIGFGLGLHLAYSYAQKIKRLRIGGNVKVIHRRAGKFATAWGFGIDLGLQYQAN
ncbi:MAG: sensor histidine kinase, partial [Bacteroidia bacterium]